VRSFAAILTIAAFGAAAHLGLPAAASAKAPPGWRPDVRAAKRYLAHRGGNVSFAVRTERRMWGHRRLRVVPSASVLKAMLMVAYLNRRDVRHRRLRRGDLRLLRPMIWRSDNATASAIRDIVGNRGLRRLARRVGMRRFTPVAHPWGNSLVNAADQTRFFLRLERYVARRHRRRALRLLHSIVPSQRWGVGRVVPRGWELYFKGGWGSGTGAVDHQVALLRRGRLRVSVAVMTTANGSHAYGKATLRGVFRRLVRGLGVVQ
jgi:beta-lactamase class A